MYGIYMHDVPFDSENNATFDILVKDHAGDCVDQISEGDKLVGSKTHR